MSVFVLDLGFFLVSIVIVFVLSVVTVCFGQVIAQLLIQVIVSLLVFCVLVQWVLYVCYLKYRILDLVKKVDPIYKIVFRHLRLGHLPLVFDFCC